LKNYPNQHHPTNQNNQKVIKNPRSSKAKIATTLQKTPVKIHEELLKNSSKDDKKEFKKLYLRQNHD
jgi:hypothetical protein